MKLLPHLILASKSPRRRQLLEALGMTFQSMDPDTEEGHPEHSSTADQVTLSNSRVKALAAKNAMPQNQTIYIGADTLVVLEKEVLAKPGNQEEAIEMLKRLSNVRHRVVTGLVLLSADSKEEVAVSSWVRFRKLSDQEISDYVSTKEPYDKAGAYAVQGMGSLFISEIEGSYTNVMGFPIEQFLLSLSKISKLPVSSWFK